MKFVAYSLYDKVKKCFEPPQFFYNCNDCARSLSQSFSKYPVYVQDDYEVYHVGEFDTDVGVFTKCVERDTLRELFSTGNNSVRAFINENYHQISDESGEVDEV